jgi:uncharacterized membrane protein
MGAALVTVPRTSVAVWFLRALNLILLGVVWFVSLTAYGRLSGRMASWSSVWTGQPVMVARSWNFFLYPLAQAAFCAAFLGLASILFLQRLPEEGKVPPPPPETVRRIRALRTEVVYLALIFFNLIFIHLQTTRILLSYRIGPGIKRIYFVMLIVMIGFILGPYYRIRLKIVRAERDGPPGPR